MYGRLYIVLVYATCIILHKVGLSLDQSSSRWLHLWCSPNWTMVAQHWLVCLHSNSTDYSPSWIPGCVLGKEEWACVSSSSRALLAAHCRADRLRLAVLVYRCINGTAPHYLSSELQRVADIESRGRLRSSSTALLHVPRSLHKTIGDRAFPVAAARVWKMLPPAITSLPSLQTFKRALKTELFRRSYDNAH